MQPLPTMNLTSCKSVLHRAAALMPKWDIILDHLGVLAAYLDIPLIISCPKTLSLCRTYYPQVNALFKEEDELTPQFLAEQYDLLFVSYRFWTAEMAPLFHLFCNKQMRMVFCPHGNSDKGYSFTDHPTQDISLIYGDQMENLLFSSGALKQIGHTVKTGNYRLPFFKMHQKFYENVARQLLFGPLDNRKKTIFYAPTWEDKENPSSFYSYCGKLIDELPIHFNLVIKLHPFLFENQPSLTTHILEKYKNHRGVLFITEFPPIYPLLSLCDIYLGDFSSVGYDFLAFDKPLYFFKLAEAPIQACGMAVPSQGIFTFIEETLEQNQTLFAAARKKTYSYAFGQERNGDAIASEILNII